MAEGKWIEGLTPEMPVVDAARMILTTRFAVVRDILPAAVNRPGEDVEHVHQLRVGTRRAGAALKLLGDSLPGKVRQRAKKLLRSLRQAAGDARDWDVFLTGLGEAKALSTEAGKPALDFLLGYALNERARAQERLVTAANNVGTEFEELCDSLANAIDESDSTGATYGERAEERIHALFAAFDEAVAANPTEPADLHQLRIQAKRVRYAMELFVGCFTPPFRDVLYPTIEKLQEILGTLQDANVGIARFEDLRTRVQQVMPAEWPRLRPGITGLMTASRRKVPTGRKQFAAWRTAWGKLKVKNPIETQSSSTE